MANEESEDQKVRERVANLIQATGRPRAAATDEELQKLKAAASRLDEMLKAAADADAQALKIAAARLDQMLEKIGSGKDVKADLKRRQEEQSKDE